MDLYPLKVSYTYHTKVWGGTLLARYVELPQDLAIGEVSLVTDGPAGSTILNGPLQGHTLSAVCGLLGRALSGIGFDPRFKDRFPLTLKLIHSQSPLSIQVHPDEHFARTFENAASGKTEAWYILTADEGASVRIGFIDELDEENVRRAIEQGFLEPLIATHTARAGDSFFLPAGQVHSIGSGIVLIEIQQNTLITWRLYDFNRIDPMTGQQRQLDIDKALKVLDLSGNFQPRTEHVTRTEGGNTISTFVLCQHFCGQRLVLNEQYAGDTAGYSFDILSCLNGSASLSWTAQHKKQTMPLGKGETVIIPAELGQYVIVPEQPGMTVFKYFIPAPVSGTVD